MSTMKKCQVVILPTNKKAKLGEYLVINKEGKLCIWNTNKFGIQNTLLVQHLYFLSDEEIKEDDYCMLKISDKRPFYVVKIIKINSIDKTCTVAFPYDKSTIEVYLFGCKKIIATTDKSLKLKPDYSPQFTVDKSPIKYPFPQPSQAFIEKYVEEYNKGNQITEIMVEYEEVFDYKISYEVPFDFQLKVNPKDNTITIKKVKDSWCREEVVTLTLKMQHDFEQYKKSCHYGPNLKEIAEWTDNWIEENL